MTNPWSYRPSNKDIGFEIAKELGKETTNAEEAVKFFMSAPAEKILDLQTKRFLNVRQYSSGEFDYKK